MLGAWHDNTRSKVLSPWLGELSYCKNMQMAADTSPGPFGGPHVMLLSLHSCLIEPLGLIVRLRMASGGEIVSAAQSSVYGGEKVGNVLSPAVG